MNERARNSELPSIVRRIAFTCDFLRFSLSEQGPRGDQPRNLAWLMALLTASKPWRNQGLEVNRIIPPAEPESFAKYLNNSAAATRYRADPEIAWAERYDKLPIDIFPSLFDSLFGHDLVVGFEMSPTIRRCLHARQCGYINFYVHPLRFLRDLCLGATTNVASIGKSLDAHRVGDHEIHEQVGRFRALFLRHRLPSCAIPSGIPILAGQTERDSVLIVGGRFADWADYEETLESALSDFDEVVFLEHPYRPTSSRVVEYLRTRHGKTVISTNANSYGILFSNPQIPKVVTLASSLGVEARALGFPTDFLLSDPQRKFLLDDIEVASTPLGHGVLSASFWDHILNRGENTKAQDAFCLGENYLRNSLDSWSFRPLQNGLAGLTSRKALLPAATLSDERRDALLAALTSFDPLPPVPASRSVERAAKAGVELKVLEGPLRLGERRTIRLSGGGPVPCVSVGFHPPETWGVWSCALSAELTLSVAPDDVARGALLRISLPVSVYEGLLPHCPVLRLSANGNSVGYALFRPSTTNWQTLEFTVATTTPSCRIGLELSELESPASLLDPYDPRWLGVGLVEFEVECVAREEVTESRTTVVDAGCVWGLSPRVAHLSTPPRVPGSAR
jgi:hypothetical protein